MATMPAKQLTGSRAQNGRRRSLVRVWFACTAHPLLTLTVVVALEMAATGGLVWWAGWDNLAHALALENADWFALCGAGQLIAYLGYALALRSVAAADEGVELSFPASLAVVSVGFGPMFSASTGGGFSVDYVTLRETGISGRDAFRRVLALSVLEYAVLAPAVAACGLLLYLGIGGSAPASVTLPWLAVIPGALIAAWLTSPRRAKELATTRGRDRPRRGLAHTVAALAIVRSLVASTPLYSWGFIGAALYWFGDILTFWAALRAFDLHLPIAILILAYGTGWALTRRSLPFGGPGVVEILFAYTLTWFHLKFAPAAAAVVGYRLFNFWLALLPATAVLPFGRRLQKQLTDAPPSS
jgi:uncharacterized membrane protein YbhN (UPF0104 family)